MSIHEQMGWLRYREIEDEIRQRDRERLLHRSTDGGDATGRMGRPGRVSLRHRIGWRIMRVGARIAATERP